MIRYSSKMYCVLSLLLAAICTPAFSTPVGFDRNALLTRNFTDLPLPSELGVHVDPRFSVGVITLAEQLNGLSTYMNIAYFMSLAAQENFRGQLPPNIPTMTIAPWNNVKMDLLTLNGQRIERRFFIWGLYYALLHFAHGQFHWAAFQLKWNGQRVAALIFESVRTSDLSITGANATSPSTSNSSFESPGSEMVNADVSIDVDYAGRAKTLPIPGTFSALTAALIHLASQNTNTRLAKFQAKELEWKLNFGLDYAGVPIRAPVINNGQACQAVWESAKFLVGERRFAEFIGYIHLNGRPAARLGMFDQDTPQNDVQTS